MHHFCVVLLLLLLTIVSGLTSQTTGDTWVNVTGSPNQDVLLPCDCPNRDLTKTFKWQKEIDKMPILIINETEPVNGYENRTKIFLKENGSNCSLLLKKITTDDSGNYSCRFWSKTYEQHWVNLKVLPEPLTGLSSAESQISHTNPPKTSRQFFAIFPVLVLLLVVGYLWNMYFSKRRRNWEAQNQEVTQLSSEDV